MDEEYRGKWKNLKPVPEHDMEAVGDRYTVCTILREIYHKTDDPEIKLKCRMATTMAKKMAGMITEFKGRGWGKKFYPYNPNKRKENDNGNT